MSYTFTVALPEDVELELEDGMFRMTFNRPGSLFEMADQFKGLEAALLAGLGYGSDIEGPASSD